MLQKSSRSKTMELFFLNPTKEMYLMDISRKIKVAHTSVKRDLDTLVKSNILLRSVEKKGKRKFPLYKANINNKVFKKHKIIYNLSSIFESKIIEHLEGKVMPKSIVLFGSYQRGEDTEESDIDLFIECKEEKVDLHVFEKKLGRRIQLHFNDGFSSYPKELKNNIANGIVLNGFLEVYT